MLSWVILCNAKWKLSIMLDNTITERKHRQLVAEIVELGLIMVPWKRDNNAVDFQIFAP